MSKIRFPSQIQLHSRMLTWGAKCILTLSFLLVKINWYGQLHVVQLCLGWSLAWWFWAMFLWTAVLTDFLFHFLLCEVFISLQTFLYFNSCILSKAFKVKTITPGFWIAAFVWQQRYFLRLTYIFFYILPNITKVHNSPP